MQIHLTLGSRGNSNSVFVTMLLGTLKFVAFSQGGPKQVICGVMFLGIKNWRKCL